MFVGHLAVSLGAKVAEPRAPLAALVAASFGLDLLWPLLLLMGIETVSVAPGNTAFTPLAFDSYPWSHSLLMAVVWGSVAGGLTFRVTAHRRVSLLVGGLVVSHWLLDLVTHRPDLPLWPSGPLVGLGVWHSIAATLLLEGALFLTMILLFVRSLPARDATGRWALWTLVGLTTIIWVSQPWSPPPPSTQAVAGVGLATWILPCWAWWIDQHRQPRDAATR